MIFYVSKRVIFYFYSVIQLPGWSYEGHGLSWNLVLCLSFLKSEGRLELI